PDADSDGDGFSNIAEYLAGTNPNAAGDRLEMSRAEMETDGFTVRWLARFGVDYRVMVSPDLRNWSELAGSRITGAGTEVAVTDPDTAAAKFYRVEVI